MTNQQAIQHKQGSRQKFKCLHCRKGYFLHPGDSSQAIHEQPSHEWTYSHHHYSTIHHRYRLQRSSYGFVAKANTCAVVPCSWRSRRKRLCQPYSGARKSCVTCQKRGRVSASTSSGIQCEAQVAVRWCFGETPTNLRTRGCLVEQTWSETDHCTWCNLTHHSVKLTFNPADTFTVGSSYMFEATSI